MRHFPLAICGALGFSACSGDGGDDTSGLFQELVSAENTAARLSCQCDRETFPSVSECTGQRTPSGLERMCKLDAYAALPDGGAAAMACVAEAQRVWAECIETMGCRDFAACGSARDAQIAACGNEEATIRARCYFIDCASGEEIPSTARCNGVRDCADGSDETTCFAGGS